MLAFTRTSQPPNICNEVKAVQQFGRQFTKFWKALFDVETLGNVARVCKRCFCSAGYPSVPIGVKRRFGK